jgi:hypothetical protein
MKKIKAYQGDTLEFHNKVINSKHHRSTDPEFKNRVLSLNPIVKEQFEEYNKQFNLDNLTSLSTKINDVQEKNDLRSLYNYDTKPFQELNDILTTGSNNTRQPLCPNCTVNNVNTFDHLIPQSEFAEFADLPTNLIPCCSYCNSKKSANWRIGNKRKYLNLYIDDLPNVQYLFAELSIIDSTIKVKFIVDNRNNIEIEFFTRIYNHYKDLELCDLFSRNCDNTISEIKTELHKYRVYLHKDVLKKINIDIEAENFKKYGFNYWKSILKIECVTNNTIFDFLLG